MFGNLTVIGHNNLPCKSVRNFFDEYYYTMISTDQLFTSLKADLRQDMNGELICSRHLIMEHFLEGSTPLRLWYVNSKHRIIVFVILLI